MGSVVNNIIIITIIDDGREIMKQKTNLVIICLKGQMTVGL